MKHLTLLATLLLAPQTALEAADSPRPSKPNIVIIFFGDMGYRDIGPFGAKKQKTPRLDRMAREGMKLAYKQPRSVRCRGRSC